MSTHTTRHARCTRRRSKDMLIQCNMQSAASNRRAAAIVPTHFARPPHCQPPAIISYWPPAKKRTGSPATRRTATQPAQPAQSNHHHHHHRRPGVYCARLNLLSGCKKGYCCTLVNGRYQGTGHLPESCHKEQSLLSHATNCCYIILYHSSAMIYFKLVWTLPQYLVYQPVQPAIDRSTRRPVSQHCEVTAMLVARVKVQLGTNCRTCTGCPSASLQVAPASCWYGIP